MSLNSVNVDFAFCLVTMPPDTGCCAGCGGNGNLKSALQRGLGDFLLVSMTLLALLVLASRRR